MIFYLNYSLILLVFIYILYSLIIIMVTEIAIGQIIQDLSVLMIIASAMAFISYKLKQPLVIGYIIAGIIIGPRTPLV